MAKPKDRSIIERWVITGTLELLSPAHFGSGDTDPLVDMPLLYDEATGKPLLSGASIAGALRSFLREFHSGFGAAEQRDSACALLFGSPRTSNADQEGFQSALIVNDALGHEHGVELRDGVAINAETRTAEDKKKFDIQLLTAGTTFNLHFELIVGAGHSSRELRSALADALEGFEQKQITLGGRKRRGFGLCQVSNWQVWKYDLSQPAGLLAWLASERSWTDAKQIKPEEGRSIRSLLAAGVASKDARNIAHLTAEFTIDGTLLVRSGFGKTDTGPDMVHLHSPRGARRVPIIPGTSWAGVLRQRARMIARTLSNNRELVDEKGSKLTRKDGRPLYTVDSFIDHLFGPSEIKREEKNSGASRITIRESEIEASESMVITRVKIDRFTGGALESALFSEQPAIGTKNTRLTLDLTLRDPRPAEIGLLLLLLKDLWTGDLPVGGESGVGRGRLKGCSALLTTQQGTWKLTSDGKAGVSIDAHAGSPPLDDFVAEFNKEMENGGVR